MKKRTKQWKALVIYWVDCMLGKLDNRPAGMLDEFHAYREKEYNFRYFCPRCIRNFETKTPAEECKLCEGPVRLIYERKGKKEVKRASFADMITDRFKGEDKEKETVAKTIKKPEEKPRRTFRLKDVNFPKFSFLLSRKEELPTK